jgi:hypothetical protein
VYQVASRQHISLLALFVVTFHGPLVGRNIPDAMPPVFDSFDVRAPEGGPFPSDVFTVPNPLHATGQRLALPLPDCAQRPSDCHDLDVINTLDGWGLQPRLSVPFTGPIDPASVTSDTVFVVSLDSTSPGRPIGEERIGINQAVWDVATNTLHVELDRLLDQHRRYAVIVTTGVRDSEGRRVRRTAAFASFVTTAPSWYAEQLRRALAAARAIGVPPGQVAAASVFTTQTITSVMERIRDDVKAATPAPADFELGPASERAVFNPNDVSSVVFRQHTRANPAVFVSLTVSLAQLNAIPGSVGTIAYGRYVSPEYLLRPGEYIPAVGTLAETPPVQRYADVYFTLYLPAGPKPPGGWPIVIAAGGLSGNRHVGTTIFASSFASQGLATIGISQVGQGFGPLGRLVVTRTNGTTLDLPDPGRGADQNGDDVYAPLEGAEAAAPRTWTVSLRDTHRQTTIDLMQLVRVIEIGMDVDGDSIPDLDPSRIGFHGSSAGTMYGTSFVALEPAVTTATFTAGPGIIPEHARWQPVRRSVMAVALQARIPSLINPPGLATIDGVPTPAPHFNENKPLRNQPTVVNTLAGAIEIQQALEFAEMAGDAGIGAVPWARYLRAEPLPGNSPKEILIQMARGDQNSVNPGTSLLVREGQLAERTTLYRHDLAFAADPAIPKNPHIFAAQPTSPNATVRAIALGAQEQAAVFFRSLGMTIIHPSPGQWFEVPLAGALPETLGFIP